MLSHLLTSLLCVQCLCLAQVLTTEGCCGVSEAWLIHSGSGWGLGLGTVLWKASSLSTVYFGSRFCGALWRSRQTGTIKSEHHREICSWFGHILDKISIGRAGESLVCPVLGLQMNYDGFNLFLGDTNIHVGLSALHRIQWQKELLWGFSETF